ncbi:uncharacterized protein M421DRAFT_1583 [Didymella exigua CBS 183.55]|uniref:Uncharacterized protein n=1 Tax=Didymella exigua CBS 183.55 TaxID=1150837 RepID=A0A6A5RX84_9PLEO|nr:uncharacterized protein M421DRAFT_1583 [Didymella exigua CBS 183.55]KAF1933011.1 hypothetical protein M421DRAFT_1583 [Didymella exigua CBS 183.55]
MAYEVEDEIDWSDGTLDEPPSTPAGRYYLAGDKRSCPRCGSNKGGLGKPAVMGFYLPLGVVIRQEMADGEAKWKPRKPYKMRAGTARDTMKKKKKKKKKNADSSHNQIASRKHWAAIDAGKTTDGALAWAVRATDRWLDEWEDEAGRRAEERELARENRGAKGTGAKPLAKAA